MEASARLRPADLLLGSLSLGILAGLFYLLRRFYHDDAYILLRYARNLLDGRGLVWNPGEAVEGYTSLLWVLASSALVGVGVDLETASRILGVASLLALFLLLIRREGAAGARAVLVLAACGPVVAWSMGGLETLGFPFLTTAALLGAERLVDADLRTFDPATDAPSPRWRST